MDTSDSRVLIKSIEGEFRRYKSLAEGGLAQVPDGALSADGPAGGNSLAVICWHVSGNLKSRFSDFLVADGEKPWRQREEEFARRSVTRAELMAKWEDGWSVLLGTLGSLADADLTRFVHIRRQPLAVHEALHRSLAHVSYHVGQIVYLAHQIQGPDWKYLSIAPGKSDEYNADPRYDKPLAHATRVEAQR